MQPEPSAIDLPQPVALVALNPGSAAACPAAALAEEAPPASCRRAVGDVADSLNLTLVTGVVLAAYLIILMLVFTSMVALFGFTAEDAFITYRYAENLINSGALVYNQGEPINAMTSPLHALVSAALYLVTGQTDLSNKLMGLALLLISAWLVWHRFRRHPQCQVLALALVLTPPSVQLWTFGGLETPLLLFLVTVTVCLADQPRPLILGRLCAVCILAGLGFLARYDASLFFAPLVLHVILRARSVGYALTALAAGALLPLTWLAVSVFYYGDVLPTSFYVKTPDGALGSLFYNGQYVVANLVLNGIALVLLLTAFLLLRGRCLVRVLRQHFRQYWWLDVGLALILFSFRFFVPYIPVTAWLVVDLLRQALDTPADGAWSRRQGAMLAGMVLSLGLFQGYQTAYTYDHSMNGLAPLGEYRAIGVRDYARFLQLLEAEALEIEQHWAQNGGDEERRPRILTFAAGVLPYTLKDAYIYEQLVSYRHCFQRHEQARYADYIHILVPRLGTLDQQLPEGENHYALVVAHTMTFDGSPQSFLVYFNPEPEAHNLSVGISDPCR
jgi:arabinofuranosyltransferase